MYYTDPLNNERYDTIGTPKLPVPPTSKEGSIPPPKTPDEVVNITMKTSEHPITGDTIATSLYTKLLVIGILGIGVVGVSYKKKHSI